MPEGRGGEQSIRCSSGALNRAHRDEATMESEGEP
jgi:hypothetical protein